MYAARCFASSVKPTNNAPVTVEQTFLLEIHPQTGRKVDGCGSGLLQFVSDHRAERRDDARAVEFGNMIAIALRLVLELFLFLERAPQRSRSNAHKLIGAHDVNAHEKHEEEAGDDEFGERRRKYPRHRFVIEPPGRGLDGCA